MYFISCGRGGRVVIYLVLATFARWLIIYFFFRSETHEVDQDRDGSRVIRSGGHHVMQ